MRYRTASRHLIPCASLLLATAFPVAHAEGPWTGLWDHCQNLHTPSFDRQLADFKGMVGRGPEWDRSVKAETGELDMLADKTCKEWAANPNGHTALANFTQKFTAVSADALRAQAQARDDFLARLTRWNQEQRAEARRWRTFRTGAKDRVWERDFPCSGAFAAAATHVKTQMQVIERRFERLRKECPAAADFLPARAPASLSGVKAAPAAGAPVRVPTGTLPKRESDITGTKPKKP